MKTPMQVTERDGSVWIEMSLAELESERDSRDRRIAELEAALEPFAKAADIRLCGEWEDRDLFCRTDVGFHLNFGDLRKARSALTPGEKS